MKQRICNSMSGLLNHLIVFDASTRRKPRQGTHLGGVLEGDITPQKLHQLCGAHRRCGVGFLHRFTSPS